MSHRFNAPPPSPADMRRAHRDIAKRVSRYRDLREDQEPGPGDDMITVAALAKRARLPYHALMTDKRAGRLEAVRRRAPNGTRAWYVTEAEAERYMAGAA